jgi:hypothetical protein
MQLLLEAAALIFSSTAAVQHLVLFMDDIEFDCDIDIEFYESVAYRNQKLYGITTNYFVLE